RTCADEPAGHRRARRTERSEEVTGRPLRVLALLLVAATLGGCASFSPTSLSSWVPPAPNWDKLFGKSNKPGPLPELTATRTAQIEWQVGVGRSMPGFAPAVTAQSVYAASREGTIVRL